MKLSAIKWVTDNCIYEGLPKHDAQEGEIDAAAVQARVQQLLDTTSSHYFAHHHDPEHLEVKFAPHLLFKVSQSYLQLGYWTLQSSLHI